METPTHGMSYRFDFDLSSKSEVKTYTVVSNMSCELVKAALEGSTGEFCLMRIFLLILFNLLAIYHSLKKCQQIRWWWFSVLNFLFEC